MVVDLLAQLRELGCEVYADGKTLRVRDPRRALTEELRQAIRERKAELLEALAVDKPEAPAPPPGPVPAPTVDKPQEHHTDAAGLVTLARRRGLVHFRTPRFPGKELYLARDAEAAKGAPAGAVVFTLQELRELATKLPEEHVLPTGATKVYFGGQLHIEPGKDPVVELGGES